MIYLIGTGVMAKEYVKVLLAMGVDFKVIGNSKKSCKSFESETDVSVIPGGDKALAKLNVSLNDKFILAVPVEALATTTAVALKKGAEAPFFMISKSKDLIIGMSSFELLFRQRNQQRYRKMTQC